MSKSRNPKRPTSFGSILESLSWIKRSVYLIVRGRANAANPEEMHWRTLGSGFVIAPNRLATASHVLDKADSTDPMLRPAAGDTYWLIHHDDEDKFHYSRFVPDMVTQLFLYPSIDLGILYLEDSFYQDGEKVFLNKDDFIRVDQKRHRIGTEAVVLGYPLCKLDFDNRDLGQPKLGQILLRADAGIINCRYNSAQNVEHYEFTMAFNPGNSGGPIFDPRTGMLLSIVSGYKFNAINTREQPLTAADKQRFNIAQYAPDSFIEVVHATYSMGYATPSFIDAFRQHQII